MSEIKRYDFVVDTLDDMEESVVPVEDEDGAFVFAPDHDAALAAMREALRIARRALFDHGDMRYIAPAVEAIDAACTGAAEVSADAARLFWLANDIGVDQIGDIDLHERSCEYAEGNEPKPEDFLRAVRDAIDAELALSLKPSTGEGS